ncbi:hypothetical protein VW35_19455 [Devosia soli]|uniref:Uncharacterized protein n=1 Tax=Devosia soli TaxID=361041 RepID=A0A0F5L135_9HYPH|nr:hypothetical protein [Devosia soli]KKB75924.1 hypothetical protein VW35_19455 [Devosia soli]
MADIFSSFAMNLAAPAAGAFAISPNNAAVFDQPTRAVYVGGGGTLEVEMLGGGTITFEGLSAGALLPIRVVRVLTGTSAASLIGLY